MKPLFTVAFLLATSAFGEGVLVAIPDTKDQAAVAAQIAAMTAANTGKDVVVTDVQTGEKAEAKVDKEAKPENSGRSALQEKF